MRFKQSKILVAPWMAVLAVLVLGPASVALADPITIDFENNPNLPIKPDNFAAAGPEQTYTFNDLETISGGVVLGNPTFLAAFASNGGTFGSAPNLYGTTDTEDPSLLSAITLTIPASENITSISFVLFNGQTIPEDYHISGIADGFPFDSTLGILAEASDPNNSAISATFTSSFGAITEANFFTPNSATNGWDFFVDDIKTHTPAAAVPEPASITLLCLAVVSFAGYCYRQQLLLLTAMRRRGQATPRSTRSAMARST